MALRVVDLFEIRIIGDGLDALLEGKDLIVACHDRDGSELEALGLVHGGDGYRSDLGVHVIAQDDEVARSWLYGRACSWDLRDRAERAEKEAKRLAKDWRAKREPARAALGELKTGAEKAWGELKAALDSAITKFREPS